MKIKFLTIYYPIIAFALLFISCNKHTASPAEYVKYIESPGNGLNVKQEVNSVAYTLQYEPIDYCVMLEERSFSIPQETFETDYNRFKGLEHYTFRIDKNNMDNLTGKLGDSSKYKKGVTEYFDFGIQKDIKLIEEDDTIPCSICQFDANTGISQYYTFSLGFYGKDDPSQKEDVDRVLMYANKILHTGNVMLRIKRKAINNIPVLKMM